MDLDLHFGCALYVYNGQEHRNEMEQLFDLFTALNTDLTDEKWVFFRSIFISSKFEIFFEFSENAK